MLIESKYFLCAALGKELAEGGRADLEDYSSAVQLATDAYDCTKGCVDDGIFGVEELEQSIWCKFWYVFRTLLKDIMGPDAPQPEIIIDATPEDNTRVAVIQGKRVVLNYSKKAWCFGHDEASDEKAAFVLENLLHDLRDDLEKGLEEINAEKADAV